MAAFQVYVLKAFPNFGKIFHVRSKEQAGRLLDRLRRTEHEHFLFVTRREQGSSGTLVARIDDAGLEFFALDFLRVDLR